MKGTQPHKQQPSPTPGNFRVDHGGMRLWPAVDFEQYENFCAIAAATAYTQICPECHESYEGSSHTCRPRVTSRALTTARSVLRTAEQQLTRSALRGTRRWRTELRAASARAALRTAGIPA